MHKSDTVLLYSQFILSFGLIIKLQNDSKPIKQINARTHEFSFSKQCMVYYSKHTISLYILSHYLYYIPAEKDLSL